MASNATVFNLRDVAGGDMVTTYLESFKCVRGGATPYEGA
jgi:hypothetical protein